MRDIKFVLTPTEVEMISDALNLAYDDGDDISDYDSLMDLCSAFNVLNSTGKHVKVAIDEYDSYEDETTEDSDEDFEDTDGDDVADAEDDETVWDASCDDDECLGHNTCGCGCCDEHDDFVSSDENHFDDAWNANEPWTTEK